MGETPAPSARPVHVTRLAAGAARVGDGPPPSSPDWVALEEPLEVRVAGAPLAVLLRSPGRERELLAGFLASEGVLRGPEDLAAIEACRDPQSGEPEPNIWNVALAEGVAFAPERRRLLPVGSTCGLCGARTLDELERELPRAVEHGPLALAADFFARADAALRQAQETHRRTAGSHGAGLFSLDGELLGFAEDVGRHNAVDKVLGARLLAGDYPLERPAVLQVTGRISFEIVQKAAMAGLAVMAGAGAPTSLAVEAAQRLGLGLFGLVRPERANCYAGRVDWIDAGPREFEGG
ncbi:MAG: sulfurtransferase FdhD [Planctomycetes bacterium]|nr:sulfurtransferase FdhD [Planctomycetota bacterium]